MHCSCDGKLSKQEVKNGYKGIFGCDMKDDELDDMFERGIVMLFLPRSLCIFHGNVISSMMFHVGVLLSAVDIDRSGFFEYSEFVVASLGEKDLFRNGNLKKAFHQFDTENRGYITKSGLRRALSTFLSDSESVDDGMIRKIMEEVDRNGMFYVFS